MLSATEVRALSLDDRKARLTELKRERQEAYAEVAVAHIDTTGRDLDQVAELVLKSLETTNV